MVCAACSKEIVQGDQYIYLPGPEGLMLPNHADHIRIKKKGIKDATPHAGHDSENRSEEVSG